MTSIANIMLVFKGEEIISHSEIIFVPLKLNLRLLFHYFVSVKSTTTYYDLFPKQL